MAFQRSFLPVIVNLHTAFSVDEISSFELF